jgi:hypothetical protein
VPQWAGRPHRPRSFAGPFLVKHHSCCTGHCALRLRVPRSHTHREWDAWLVICPGMCVNCWCVCLVGRVLCANLFRCRSRVLPYAHILNRQLHQLPVPVCRLRAQGRIPAVCRLRAGPHTCSPPLPCLSSPVTVCAAAINIRWLDRPMPQRKSTSFAWYFYATRGRESKVGRVIASFDRVRLLILLPPPQQM